MHKYEHSVYARENSLSMVYFVVKYFRRGLQKMEPYPKKWSTDTFRSKQ